MDSERLRTLRDNLRKHYPDGYQPRIAKELKCSIAMVNKVLNGKYPYPKPKIVEKAIELLKEANSKQQEMENKLTEVTNEICPDCYGTEAN